MALTTTSTISSGVQEYYDKLFLAVATPLLTHSLWAQQRSMKSASGNTIRFRRYGQLSNASQLTEGVTPAGKQLSATDLTATVAQYGDYVTLTDEVMVLQPDPNIQDAVEVLAKQEHKTTDELMRDIMLACNSVYYANDVATQSDIVARFAAADVKKIIRSMKGLDAVLITEMITASTGIGTTPLAPAFVGVTHSDAEGDISDIDGFVPVANYASQKTVMDGEIGQYGNLRIICTSVGDVDEDSGGALGSTGNESTTGSNCDVYKMVIVSEESYADVALDKHGTTVIIKAPEKKNSNTGDPLNQRVTVGWKRWWCGKVLNDNWIYRYEFAVSG